MFEKLFSPIKIGNMELANRLTTAPMEVLYCDEDGKVTDRYLSYVEERAKGGWGLIINEAHAVVKGGGGFNRCSGMWMDEQIPGQKKVAEIAHKYGTKIAIQLIHIGRQSETRVTRQPNLVAPTAIQDPSLYEVPKALTIDEIKAIVSAFGDAAYRVKQAGYDAVEVHGSHGYLIQEFLSPYSNKRTDEYGGPLFNRARFSMEIVADIRKKCGPDFPIIFRIASVEFVADGLNIAETRPYAQMLERAGVDCIHCSQGNYAHLWAMLPPSNAVPKAYSADWAAEIKKVVSIPVITVARYNDPFVAEAALASDKADMVAMARQSLADPYLPKKAKEGNIEDIRYCIGCNQGCVAGIYAQVPVTCLVNPECGYEGVYKPIPAEEKKKVVVVGGGPAGIEAALAADVRGHDVTLYEKSGDLGGQWLMAAVPPHKQEFATFTVWLKTAIAKSKVKVKLNTEFTEANLDADKPDAVIIATGAKPIIPNIPGIDGDNVIFFSDLLSYKKACKGTSDTNVVIVGGGQIGAEVSNLLGQIRKKVTLLEMSDAIAADGLWDINEWLFKDMEAGGVKVQTNAKVVEITKDSVIFEQDGQKKTIPGVDHVVIAVGMQSFNELEQIIKGKVKKVVVVGDAIEPRKALQATAEGYKAGYEIEKEAK